MIDDYGQTNFMTKIKHELDKRFYIENDEGDAFLDYEREDDVINILHVYVAASLRGQGIAEALTREALEYVKLKRYRVIPSCPYVSQTFLRRHPEYQELID
jgi:predicted GNAT family acetyltransferase